VRNAYFCGWADEDTLYLLPETAFRAVSEAIRAQGDYLALGKNELLAALVREGFIIPGKGGRTTQTVRIQGGVKRVIWLPFDKYDEVMEDEPV
jgi:hypothetical protein